MRLFLLLSVNFLGLRSFHFSPLAWCDGPPYYAYHYGLTNARKHLAALGAPEPSLPPFDPARHDPMPEVELNPDDKFHVSLEAWEKPGPE